MEEMNYDYVASDVIRINLFVASVKNIFLEHNVLGLGPGAFPSIIGINSGTGIIVDPHNFLAEIAVECGLLVLVLFFVLVWKILKRENDRLLKISLYIFFITGFCSSRFASNLWNWFFMTFIVLNSTYYRNYLFKIGEKNVYS